MCTNAYMLISNPANWKNEPPSISYYFWKHPEEYKVERIPRKYVKLDLTSHAFGFNLECLGFEVDQALKKYGIMSYYTKEDCEEVSLKQSCYMGDYIVNMLEVYITEEDYSKIVNQINRPEASFSCIICRM